MKLYVKTCEDLRPLLSIIVVNYNSERFFGIVRAGLESIFSIPIAKEVIIVDNGSRDKSRSHMLYILNELKCVKCSRVKLLLLDENTGFSNAINIAIKLLDKSSKYVMIVNNDCVVYNKSIPILIKVLETSKIIGCVQGKILKWDDRTIDSAGCLVTQFGNWLKLGHGLSKTLLNFPYLITYAHAALFVCRREAFHGFLPHFYVFGDDFELGPRLYIYGYASVYYPVVVGRHYGSATSVFNEDIAKLTRLWSTIGTTAVIRIANLNGIWVVWGLIKIIIELLASVLQRDKQKTYGLVRGLIVGLSIKMERYKLLRSSKGKSIKVPMLKIKLRDIPLLLVKGRRRTIYSKYVPNYIRAHALKLMAGS